MKRPNFGSMKALSEREEAMSIRQTHTFSILEISKAAYEEIKGKLTEAGYEHAIIKEGEREVIDMNGIAVGPEAFESVDIKNVRQHCGHHAKYLYRDDNNDIRCSVCGQLR